MYDLIHAKARFIDLLQLFLTSVTDVLITMINYRLSEYITVYFQSGISEFLGSSLYKER